MNSKRHALALVAMTAVVGMMGGGAGAASLYWDANTTTAGAGATPSGTWGTGSFWNTDATGGGGGAFQIPTTANDDLFCVAGPSATSGNNAYTITVSGGQVAKSLSFQASGGTTISGGASITLGDGTTGGVTMGQCAYGSAAQGAVTISTPVTLNGAQTWLNDSAGTLTVNGAVDNGGNLLTVGGTGGTTLGAIILSNSGGLTKSGAGYLNLRLASLSYTGSTMIDGGTILYGNNYGSGNLALNGGVLEDYYGGSLTRSLGAATGQFQITGGSSGFSGAGLVGFTVTINNNAGYEVVWGGTYFTPGTLVLQAPTANSNGKVIFQNKIDLNGADRTIAVNKATDAGGYAQISGVIRNSAGTAGLIKTGPGRLILSGSNTYNGDTTISRGTLQLNAANPSNDLSTVTIAASGATNILNFAGSDTVDKLFIGATQRVAGEYGHANSGADNGGLGVGALNAYFGAGTGKLVVTSNPPDTIPPTLAPEDIVDDKLGGPVAEGVLVIYTVTFSEDMDASTVSAADFGNVGTANLTIDPVTETSLGVFRVPVTATATGTLQLAVNAGADLRDFAGNPLDTSSAIADDTIIAVKPAEILPPTLAPGDIVDDQSGGPVTAGTLVTYTVTFSEDLDATTVSAADFGNAGDAMIIIGPVTEASPGVFSVPVTPTGAGTLQLRVNAGAVLKDVAGNALDTSSAIADDTTITVTVPMLIWDANGATAGQTDGAGAWLNANQWWDGGTNRNWAAGADAVFGNGGAGGAVTLAGQTMVHALTLNAFSGTYTLGAAGQTITLNAGIVKNTGGTAATIASPVTLGGAQTWLNSSAGLLTASAAVDNGGNRLTVGGTGSITLNGTIGGAGGLTKSGAGRLNFNIGTANTYSGPTTLNGGVLMIGTDANSLGSGNLALNGGVLEYYWTGSFTRTLGAGAGQVQLTGGASGFSENGSGLTVTLNGSAGFVVVWGSAYFNPTALVLQAASAQSSATRNAVITFQNILDLNGTNRTVRVDQIPTAGVDPNGGIISGVIRNTGADPAGLIKAGVGKLTLSGVNTFDGDTKVEAGTLKIAGSSTLANGAALRIAAGAKVDLAAGVNETVTYLYLNGAWVDPGTWGSSASSAGHMNDAYFSGSGILNVLDRPRVLDSGMILIVR